MKPNTLYKNLQKKYKNLNWWPRDDKYHKKNCSDPRFEIIIGAVLTQNTSWSNVEKVINNLKSKKMLDIKKISKIDEKNLGILIKSSGFFNQKSKRLKNLANYFLNSYNSDLNNFFNNNVEFLREELLNLDGIGPETADSILLYAGGKPIFVVDAYTKRICERIPINVELKYEKIQEYFQSNLSEFYNKNDLPKIFNEFHAQIVYLAKDFCKKKPLCQKCPLKKNCEYKKSISTNL